MSDLDKRGLKTALAMRVLTDTTVKTIGAVTTVAEKMNLDVSELCILYFSDCLEDAITVANACGTMVELDGFFDAMKEKIRNSIDNFHPAPFKIDDVDVNAVREVFGLPPVSNP